MLRDKCPITHLFSNKMIGPIQCILFKHENVAFVTRYKALGLSQNRNGGVFKQILKSQKRDVSHMISRAATPKIDTQPLH